MKLVQAIQVYQEYHRMNSEKIRQNLMVPH